MPLGKYFCDYCEKQFQDTPAARKRHLQGAQHQRARAAWYDAVRHQDQHGGAPSLLLPDGTIAKGVCHHFVRTGTCKYGDSCRYFHPKPDGVNPALVPPGPGTGATAQQSNIFGGQSNFVGHQSAERNPFSGNILGGHTSWGNLPPSLQPPPEGAPCRVCGAGNAKNEVDMHPVSKCSSLLMIVSLLCQVQPAC